jgi:hypothetical protein
MHRHVLIAIMLSFLGGGLLGCNKEVPPAEERPGPKERKEIQKEKSGQRYMKPTEK